MINYALIEFRCEQVDATIIGEGLSARSKFNDPLRITRQHSQHGIGTAAKSFLARSSEYRASSNASPIVISFLLTGPAKRLALFPMLCGSLLGHRYRLRSILDSPDR